MRIKDISKTNEGNTCFHRLRYDVNASSFYKVDVEINLEINLLLIILPILPKFWQFG